MGAFFLEAFFLGPEGTGLGLGGALGALARAVGSMEVSGGNSVQKNKVPVYGHVVGVASVVSCSRPSRK